MMTSRKTLSYNVALRLLGEGESAIVTALGRAGGVVATGISLTSVGTLDFFALRDEIVAFGNSTLGAIRSRVNGARRYDRTTLLAAAHAVLVVTAFYEALEEVLCSDGEIDFRCLELSSAEQVALATGGVPARRYRELVADLVDAPIPMPAPYQSYEETLTALRVFYGAIASKLTVFASGLAAFDTDQDRLTQSMNRIAGALIPAAIGRYEAAFRKLASDVPEFYIWASMTDAQATRASVKRLAADLRQQLDQLLSAVSGNGSTIDARLAELTARARTRLARPVIDTNDASDGIMLPTLSEAFISPHYRVRYCEVRGSIPAAERWWSAQPIGTDAFSFITGHLTYPEATESPLVVLGQPGSGKSVLVQILAARLSGAGFLPIRVQLRDVPADASIQGQVEDGIYQAIGEHLSWPAIARAAGDALPVVLLDGFDELLQASGIDHADYLEKVREFQQREADLERPVAAIVTTRTVVADRVRFPPGCLAVRLERFDEGQVRDWVRVWNTANASSFAKRGVRELEADTVLQHGELAGEPLLLLMLALYDADRNALQRSDRFSGRAELYERLFKEFARREVRKDTPQAASEEEWRAIEAELYRLGVAAVAMFNRGSEFVGEVDLDNDMRTLLISDRVPMIGKQKSVSAAQPTVGRFFFMFDSQATHSTGTVARTYEFVHATFREFLVARIVINTVIEVMQQRAYQKSRPMPGAPDAQLLHAVGSFGLLCRSPAIVDFCRGLISQLDGQERFEFKNEAACLLRDLISPYHEWSFSGYEPRYLCIPARYAIFSANLVLLAVLGNNNTLNVGWLLDTGIEAAAWRRLALLWQSQLTSQDWSSLWAALRVSWSEEWDTEDEKYECYKILMVALEDHSDMWITEAVPYRIGGLADEGDPSLNIKIQADTSLGKNIREAAFLADRGLTLQLIHDIMPLWRNEVAADHASAPEGISLAWRQLAELRFSHMDDLKFERRRSLYYECQRSLRSNAKYRSLVYRQLQEDVRCLEYSEAREIFIYFSKIALSVNQSNRCPGLEISDFITAFQIVAERASGGQQELSDLVRKIGLEPTDGFSDIWELDDTREGIRTLYPDLDIWR